MEFFIDEINTHRTQKSDLEFT